MKKKSHLTIILLIVCELLQAQSISINWENNTFQTDIDDNVIKVMDFEGANHSRENHYLPFYSHFESVGTTDLKLSFVPEKTIPIALDSIRDVAGLEYISEDFIFEYDFSYLKKQPMLTYKVVPIRYNKANNCYEKLLSFRCDIEDVTNYDVAFSKQEKEHINSVLATGVWHKILIPENGFYKISYEELKNMGIDVTKINPKTIKLYGNGGRMLPESNSEQRYDDLHEVPITVIGENDGSFDASDYILFYGDGPDEWKWDDSRDMYLFHKNLYTRKAGYFLTYGGKEGKRISYKETPAENATSILSSYVDYRAIEPTLYHLTKSGKAWFGDRFDSQTTYTYDFSFPNINQSKSVALAYGIAVRAFTSSSFKVETDNYSNVHSFRAVGTTLSSNYANEVVYYTEFEPKSSNIAVTMHYNRPNNNASAWLRFIYINAERDLTYNGGTLFFRYPTKNLNGSVGEYRINSPAKNITIFDITNPAEPTKIYHTTNGNTITFKDNITTNKEYVCFDNSDLKSVTYGGVVYNQNIHGMATPDMVIVYHKDFETAATKLYNYHNTNGLTTYMLDIQNIYNEFSSGVQDVCAIRDMMRYWYKNADENDLPQYLLLLGDASYDPLDRLSNNTNFIPVFQSPETLQPSYSYCSDEFYCFLDDEEGNMGSHDLMDISVGRIPVQTTDMANKIVDKILHYASNGTEQMGNWRNIVTLSCDDADNTGIGYETRHLDAAEKYASIIETEFKPFQVNKIYTSAYPQVTAAGGQRYPEVNDAINARMEQGTLLFGYNGHGGELCLALEQIVTIADINSWSNYDRLTFMVTATCEFSRYDDPARTSAGELVLLNPKGGAFGMLTTARLTDASTNLNFCSILYSNIFKQTNGKYPTVGQFVMESKNQYILKGHSFANVTPHVTLGDPAIPINYPKHSSATITKIEVDGQVSDTIKSMSTVVIEGQVNDANGNIMSNFNGTLYPELRDKPITIATLGNDGAPVQYFNIDKSTIYKGKTPIENGKFKFTFITPKDISYNFGDGKANFYYIGNNEDGNGYYDNYIVGGSSDYNIDDNEGPEIKLYLNDSSFADGDNTNENPVILATLYDKSGINTTGNGIGHDIIATIDNDTERTYILNSYYENDLGSYQKGSLTYPLFGISEGSHQLQFRAWDVCNNSSTKTLNFVVVNSNTIKLTDLICYPNPFDSKANFQLKHNQSGHELDVKLYIYSTDGHLVKYFSKSISTNKYKDVIYTWEGDDVNGNDLAQGIYVYKVIITNENGTEEQISGKLIKL